LRRIKLLDVSDERLRSRVLYVCGVVWIADHRRDLVAAFREQRLQQQSDLAVSPEKNDACHGSTLRRAPESLEVSSVLAQGAGLGAARGDGRGAGRGAGSPSNAVVHDLFRFVGPKANQTMNKCPQVGAGAGGRGAGAVRGGVAGPGGVRGGGRAG